MYHPKSSHNLQYLFVEKNQSEKRPRHGPLIPAVLKHDDVQLRGEHLLQHLWMQVQNAKERVIGGGVVGLLLLAGQAAEEECDDVVQR